MKWEQKKAGFLFALCIALALSLPLLAGLAVHSLLVVSPCQLASTEEGSSWECDCAWDQLRTRRKYLGRLGWGDYWCFLRSSSCCSHCPTILLWTGVQSGNIWRKTAWTIGLKYLLAFGHSLTGRPFGLSTSDNDNNNNNDNNNKRL